MLRKTKTKNRDLKLWPKPWIASLLIIMVFLASIELSQIKKYGFIGTVCAVDSKDSQQSNSDEIEMLSKKVEQFLSLDDSNPTTYNSHIYFNIVTEIIPYDVLLDLAEKVVKKGIEVNTLENLLKTYPGMSEKGIKHQQKLEFGRLYCQYAWILWKKNQLENAFSTITKAMSYISSPAPNDYIRLGIIEYDNSKKQQGWDHITKALITDTIIEDHEPEYRKAIYKIIKDKYGTEQDPIAFIAEYRSQNAQMLPSLSLQTLENTKIQTRQYKGHVIFINFFSPTCGSCQQEIPGIKSLYEQFSPRKDVVFIFILNRPDLKQESISLFEKSGIQKPIIAVLQNGSAWDLISAEPSVWIKDKAGKVTFRHCGYKQGDEMIYQQKLSRLIQD